MVIHTEVIYLTTYHSNNFFYIVKSRSCRKPLIIRFCCENTLLLILYLYICVCIHLFHFIFLLWIQISQIKKKKEGIEGNFKHMKTAVQFSMLKKELFVKNCGKVSLKFEPLLTSAGERILCSFTEIVVQCIYEKVISEFWRKKNTVTLSPYTLQNYSRKLNSHCLLLGHCWQQCSCSAVQRRGG